MTRERYGSHAISVNWKSFVQVTISLDGLVLSCKLFSCRAQWYVLKVFDRGAFLWVMVRA
jgi:hypothetical protein